MLTYQPPIPFITEKLLQFIWQFQYFNKKHLFTTSGDVVTVIHAGVLNHDQGPDFLDARIRIGATTWAGHVELHVRSSEWNLHSHTGDLFYANVVLHVVWQYDKAVYDVNGHSLPALELQPLVSALMLQRYIMLMESRDFVPCASQLPQLSAIGWLSWKERLAAERLERKKQHILSLLERAGNHWDEVFWWLLARNFGIKVNADYFEQLARTLPVTLLAKHKQQIHQLEALLLGQAGLLDVQMTEKYPLLLQREYRYLRKKYALQPLKTTPSFLRMRPAGFPTIRLAQLAMLVKQSVHLFSLIRDTPKLDTIRALFNITANDYWNNHYRLDEPAAFQPKKLGELMTDNILINTVVPVLFAYGSVHHDEVFKQRAINWLMQVMPEQNGIMRQWKKLGISNYNALESQALLELKNNYCNERRCLSCAVGNQLLKKAT
jgi:hypothetical protein